MPPAGRDGVDLVRITIIGVIGEEALFRGLIWDLVQSLAHCRQRSPDLVTLAVTSVLFAVSHAQYGGFRLTPVLAGQLAYTLVAGVVLGWARGRTGSLAPCVPLHATGNAVLKPAALA